MEQGYKIVERNQAMAMKKILRGLQDPIELSRFASEAAAFDKKNLSISVRIGSGDAVQVETGTTIQRLVPSCTQKMKHIKATRCRSAVHQIPSKRKKSCWKSDQAPQNLTTRHISLVLLAIDHVIS
jgi:hypothetical protein